MTLRVFGRKPPAPSGLPQYIFDTDFDTDVGDLGNLIQTAWFHTQGLIDLRAVIVTYPLSTVEQVQAADAMLNHLGISPARGYAIGTTRTGLTGTWYEDIAANFAHPKVPATVAAVPAALSTYRSVLAEAPNNSVVISTHGGLTELNNLLTSPADSISSLTGSQLITAKVNKLIIEGDITTRASGDPNEYNIAIDASASANVCANWPTTIYMSFEDDAQQVTNVGGTGGFSTSTCPMARGYTTAGYTSGRPAWGYPNPEFVAGTGNYTLEQGTWRVTLTAGQHAWTPGAGPHYRLVRVPTTATMAARFNMQLAAHGN